MTSPAGHDPRHLWALAELHSLAAAWPHLLRAELAARIAGRDRGDLGTLRSPVYGTVRSSGPARSAVAEAVVAHAGGDNWVPPETRRLAATAEAVHWVARTVRSPRRRPDVAGRLEALIEHVPQLHPFTARHVGLHIAEEDRKVRDLLGLGDDHQHLPDAECPACGVCDLAWRVSAPVEQRVVVCRACWCTGDTCPCGMATRVADVQHVWSRAELGGLA